MKQYFKKIVVGVVVLLLIMTSVLLLPKNNETIVKAEHITVHFKWDGEQTPHIYYENVNGDGAKVISWPGIPMKQEENGWYYYTIEGASSADVIFSSLNQSYQTATLNRTTGEWWFDQDGWLDQNPDLEGEVQIADQGSTTTETEQGMTQVAASKTNLVTKYMMPQSVDATENATIKIHYYSENAVPSIYYWNSLPNNLETAWPGQVMISEGDGWYQYAFSDVTKINLLFTYGLEQSQDFTRKTGEWWYKSGKWYSKKPNGNDIPTTPSPYARTDFRDETIYFLMTTRFYDGDESNNVHCWDENIRTPEDDPAWRGDFKGLIEKLDYIKALGFSAVWITPVVENCSGLDYHGYHAMNFSKVDPRYESDDVTYQDLINACHEKDMKIIQDVVFNHTGNFGETNLAPMFEKEGDYGTIDCLKRAENSLLPDDYSEKRANETEAQKAGREYATRLALLKDTTDPVIEGVRNDPYNLYHHYGHFNWDQYSCQLGQIAGDCVDLNTENPLVAKYIVDCYTKYINMGVDAFRVDTVKHMSRLTLNNFFNPEFKAVGGDNFFMFGEVCTKSTQVWYRGDTPPLSSPFYTWTETKNYPWNYYDETTLAQYEAYKKLPPTVKYSDFSGDKQYEEYIKEREKDEVDLPHYNNVKMTEKHYNDNMDTSIHPVSTNHLLEGNNYHKPDYSEFSGLNVIDFQMHWNFDQAQKAFNVAVGGYNKNATQEENSRNSGDHSYNDATWNVTYVDSHDYAPDKNVPGFEYRFNGGTETWAENLSLMFTFRGIPCIYYGSEIEFQAGEAIDKGPNLALFETGRAYFGEYIEGDVSVSDFGVYKNATGAMAETLNYPLAKHIQRLNLIRRAIPALRKGQYSIEDITYPKQKTETRMAYKRRYTDKETDSFVCVAVTSAATFKNIPNGTYTDAVTGDIKEVTDGILEIEESGKGNMRVYVLDTELTEAPGKIGEDGAYLK